MANEELDRIVAGVRKALAESNAALAADPNFAGFVDDFRGYISLPGREDKIQFHPCLGEKTSVTPLDKYYFYQDTWAARKIFELRPERVVDVGSTALLVGIISQLIPTISVDIRPLPVKLANLECVRGAVTAMPFEDASVELLSSMCVIEHIGLGRYGDPLDAQGSVKAFREVARVLRPGGHFLFSVPLGRINSVHFNAHRVFTKDKIFELLPEFVLRDELFLFPEPGSEANVAKFEDFQWCVWCAHMVRS